MIRQRKQYGGFTKPPSESSNSDEDGVSRDPVKRKANVYDAVAGRVTQAGLIGNIKDIKSSKQPLRPDEVLFRQANAPIRYEETDYYYAHAKLPANQQLPSSELLTALHAYISKLYSRTGEPGTQKAWRCMDETALIALGILMEETAREVMGETGDLAFTEAADADEDQGLAGDEEKDTREDEEETRKSASRDARTEDEPLDSWSSSGDGSQYATEESD
ncbi:Nn.00g099350.m01.CDS01 [Neocucurbitaria sp. VM-36]